MKLISLEDKKIITDIICDSKLWRLCKGTDEGRTDFKPELDKVKYIAGVYRSKIIGFMEFRPITDLICEIHLLTKPQYWGTDIPREFLQTILKYVVECTKFTNFVTSAPEVCTHVKKYFNEFGFEKAMTYKNGIIYEQRPMDLEIYTLYMKRDKI